MSSRVLDGTAVGSVWPFALHFLRTAWADRPFDALTEWLSGLSEAHLLEIVGDDVGLESQPVAGPVALLPDLLRMLRRGPGSDHRAPERLSLLTATAGDTSSLPAVEGVRADVMHAGYGVLVRDPVAGTGVCMTTRSTGAGVLRWRARGVEVCPVAPQPTGPGRANAELAEAVGAAAELIERSARKPPGSAEPKQIELPGPRGVLPGGLDTRTVSLLDRADRVEAIVDTALGSPYVGASQADREPVLRRLTSAVHSARRAAVAAAGEEALGR